VATYRDPKILLRGLK